MVSPILEQLSEEMKNIKFGKVNVDEEVELAEKFEISSIPTLMIFKDGKVISTQVGAMSKERLKSWINEAIS
jgi:thioredoxin 1